MVCKYDRLGERFLKDFNLSFKYIDFNHFKYCLKLSGYLDKWYSLEQLIYDRFNDNPQLFLDEYYSIRNKIIEDIESNKDYIWFSREANLNDYSLPEGDRNLPHLNIYTEACIGKKYLSIDLKHANFQTLYHISSSIVKNQSTYEDFISQYTDLDYLKESKYTRQVIFGKLNAKRQITAEKFFINELRKTIINFTNEEDLTLVSISNDELIYEMSDKSHITDAWVRILTKCIKKLTGFDVKVEPFYLQGYHFLNMESGINKFTFFKKVNLLTDEVKYKGIPLPYYKMAYKLANHIPLEDEDYLFDYEGTLAEFMEEFEVASIGREEQADCTQSGIDAVKIIPLKAK